MFLAFCWAPYVVWCANERSQHNHAGGGGGGGGVDGGGGGDGAGVPLSAPSAPIVWACFCGFEQLLSGGSE